MRLLPGLLTTVALSVLCVGCGSNEPAETDVPSATGVQAPSTTTITTDVAVSTTGARAESDPEGPPFEISETLDVAYQQPTEGWKTPELDVYAPVGEGPWPVVVTYHPDMAFDDRSYMSNFARNLARQGAVVFNPTYGLPGRSGEALGFYMGSDQPRCIYWYVHEHAAAFGGDPDDITLVGFSGGAIVAAATVMADPPDPSNCFAAPTVIEPRSAVLIEGDWTLAPHWNALLASDPERYLEWTVWRLIEGYEGPPLHFVVDAQTPTSYRMQIQADNIDAYFSLRPGADLRRDLESIGAFEDGILDITEANRLFHHRMVSAGKETTITTTDSGIHSITPETLDVVVHHVLSS